PLERPAQGELVRVLQVAADGQPTRDARHGQARYVQDAGEVERRGLALQVGVGAEDDLGRALGSDTGDELADLQLVRPDALQMVDRSLQHVVAALELAGPLDGDDVAGLLDDAQDVVVATGIGADSAELALGDVEAPRAEPDTFLD